MHVHDGEVASGPEYSTGGDVLPKNIPFLVTRFMIAQVCQDLDFSAIKLRMFVWSFVSSRTCPVSGVTLRLTAGFTEMRCSDLLEVWELPCRKMVNFAMFRSSTFLNRTVVHGDQKPKSVTDTQNK